MITLTLRGRLTLLYGGLILAAGALILAGIYLVVGQRLDQELGSEATDARISALRERAVAGGGSTITLPDGTTVEVDDLVDQLARDRAAIKDAAMNSLLTQGGVVVGVVAVVAGAGGWIIAGRGLRPLDLITATAERIAGSRGPRRNLHERIGPHARPARTGRRDEVRRLADAFDAMLENLDHAFDGQRRFVANASHQLRTPLAMQRAIIELETTLPDAPPSTVRLGARLLELNEANARLIDGLLLLAESEHSLEDIEPLDLADVAQAALAAAQPVDGPGPVITRRLSPAPAVGDPLLLEQLIRNLIENGIRHNVPGGTLMIMTRTEHDRAVVRVENTGPDVAEADIPALLEPFRRGRRAPGVAAVPGHGLGLAIVKAIITAHDGELAITPRPGGGLRVTASLDRPG